MHIKRMVKQVRETKEGQNISAYVVLGKKEKVIAYIHVHHSTNSKGHLKRIDIYEPSRKDGFNQYRGVTINSTLHLAVVGGVCLYDDASTGPETKALLAKYQRANSDVKRGAIYKRAVAYGMEFNNPTTEGWQGLWFVGGLKRLESFGYTVLHVL